MSTVPNAPYPQPGVPGPGPGAPSVKRVSTAGYWISIGIFVIGAAVSIVWFVAVLVAAAQAPDDYVRVNVPGQMRVELSKGEWVLYHESPGINDYSRFSYSDTPDVVVTDSAGNEVFVSPDTYSSTTYTNVGGHDGASIGSFNATSKGEYTISVSGDSGSGDSVAVGRQYMRDAVPGIIGSVILGAGAFIVALILLIVTIVRRGKAKRERASTQFPPVPYGAGPPQPYGAGPGPAAYGAAQPSAYPSQAGGYPPVPPPAGAYGGSQATPYPPAPPPSPTPYPPASPVSPVPSDSAPGWTTPAPSSSPIPPPPPAPPAAGAFPAPGAEASGDARAVPDTERGDPAGAADPAGPADDDAPTSWSPLSDDRDKPGAF